MFFLVYHCSRVNGVYPSVYVIHTYILYSFFFFKQNPAYELRISDWISDLCSSDLRHRSSRRRMDPPQPVAMASRSHKARRPPAFQRGRSKPRAARRRNPASARPLLLRARRQRQACPPENRTAPLSCLPPPSGPPPWHYPPPPPDTRFRAHPSPPPP